LTRYGSFYFPEEFKKTWERFQQIARREGKNASILLRDFVARYVDIHDPGNPQARLTSFAEGGPVDAAIIEGRVREHFRARAAWGSDVRWRDIVQMCKLESSDKSAALAMAERVSDWLRGRGVKVWR